jgi:hypothetical protein
MIDNNRGSVVLMVTLIILIMMITAGIYVARSSTIGLRVLFNEKDYTNGFYALDSVSTWFLEDPDPLIDNGATKYTQNEQDKKLISNSLLPDFQIPYRGNIRDNVQLQIAMGLVTLPKVNTGNSVWHTRAYNFHATISDTKSQRQILVGNQLILPTAR